MAKCALPLGAGVADPRVRRGLSLKLNFVTRRGDIVLLTEETLQPSSNMENGSCCALSNDMAKSTFSWVSPMLQSVRTKCPRRRLACTLRPHSRSMSSMATQEMTSGWRSSHSQISASLGALKSLVLSLTGPTRLFRSTSLSIATLPWSVRQVLDSTVAAPLARRRRSSAAQQPSKKRSSPKSEWSTPSTSRKTTVCCATHMTIAALRVGTARRWRRGDVKSGPALRRATQ